jgi:twitching motility protein PilT
MTSTFDASTELNDRLTTIVADPAVTDVHAAAGRELWVRGRHDLLPTDGGPVSVDALATWVRQLRCPDVPLLEYLKANRGADDFAVNLGQTRCRANVFLSQGTVKMVLRRLPGVMQFASLGLPNSVLSLIDRPRGIFFVTGPTGSGKSSTLGAGINHINETRQSHIITLEQPIEIEHTNKKSLISHRSVGPSVSDDSPTFADGLRYALRQNPNVIMVGEIRDAETMGIALQAASTGHLVLATLHTNGGAPTVERIAGFFDGIDRVNALSELSSSFCGVLSQEMLIDRDGIKVLAYEVLMPTTAVRASIRKADVNIIRQEMDTGSSVGHVKLNTSLLNLVRAGRITREEALYRSNDPERFGK